MTITKEHRVVKLSEIIPYANNPRKNDQAVPVVEASIERFTYTTEIEVDESMVILAGHTRWKALKKMGVEECEVMIIRGMTNEEKIAYRLAHNKTGEVAEWDKELLMEELDVIEEIPMEELGFRERVDFNNLEDMMGETDAEHQEFLDKFKPKHTTDDCFTPPEVYEAVKKWVLKTYKHKGEIVRPFYPGGDYKTFYYPKGCLVLDNPPFSIQSEIDKFYIEKGIDFFLFANGLTTLNNIKNGIHVVIAHCGIVYENGVEVNTSFLTNLGKASIVVSSELHEMVEDAQPRETADLNAYAYPDNIVTAAMLGRLATYGSNFEIKDVYPVDRLDDGTEIYGKGALISDVKAEKVKAEKVKAEKVKIQVKLSERERDRATAQRDGGRTMTGFTTGMKSSLTDEWATPSYLFDELDEEFHFTLDVCAGEDNHKTPEYFDRETDGLAQEWKGTCWMNPPYGRTIGAWVKKAYEAARGGGGGCLLTASKNGHKMVEGLRYACV